MVTKMEALYKAPEKIAAGWYPEPVLGITSYNMYVGVAPVYTSLLSLYTKISTQVDQAPSRRGKVPQDVLIADVRAALTLPATVDFSNKVFYFLITYVVGAAESTKTDSIIVEVPPVGVSPTHMRDDPTVYRQPFVFSHDLQKWSKVAGSGSGAVIVDASDFYKSNITTEYTYDMTNVKTMKSYPSDSTVPGSPAKLTTYTYAGSQVTKVTITDSTV